MSTAVAKNEEHLPLWMEKTLLAVDAQRVFIAEADPFTRKLLARRFAAEGHDVILAENGSIMLDYFLEMPRPAPGSGDVLITDVEMPEMGGFELVDRARAAGWTLPVVFVTGDPSIDVLRGAQDRRAVRCLARPFSLGELVGTIDAVAK
jgi:DNA-binding response OmpR family regulator